MALLKPIGKLLGGVLKATGIISSPGKPPAPLRAVTRDDAAAQVAADDELRRRQGAAADIVNGTGGAEAPLTGGKLTLGN
ncbi:MULTISPECIES: hypothetical protein [unclassified Sphingomonas]|uniref:hypothetical protein n=1 Tax=unclassified Sphingomonas TaxID=196159 RepID=UPI00086C0C78|nr:MULTISPECIES: hypothetical protein [unclassified Sphingomonas]MBN8848164.1 hypothetical protein [Sphingomonas sp.]ODU67058.1 MAG: hypothetical protein ABT11_21150 [Novosphingobium sp. SCN 66-18]OJV30659.1 MAG: hypothetical protein BGO24_08060 [Sphingomonas sp. 67-36]